MAAITTMLLLDALVQRRARYIASEVEDCFEQSPPFRNASHFFESQGPDLNRSVVDLQSTAWPLRHLGDRVG